MLGYKKKGFKKTELLSVSEEKKTHVDLSIQNVIYIASLCAAALALWDFSSILSPAAEKVAPTRSPTVLSESFACSLCPSYDAALVAS